MVIRPRGASVVRMHTQVAIVGAGPAGLLLAQLLHLRGIDSVVLEAKSREYIENRVRAGVLEHQSVAILDAAGVGARMRAEGLLHHGIELQFAGEAHRIDFADLTGKAVMIYGQQEVVKDLVAARLASARPLHFLVDAVRLTDLEGGAPAVHFVSEGRQHQLRCDFIAGCDGFHGVCRPSVPAGVLRAYERVYPFAWLGILAQAPPASHELIYARHEHGFALLSMRSPTLTRLYLQCEPDEALANWSDERVWEELQLRLSRSDGLRIPRGPIQQKSVTPMRSFVLEPMQHGRLYLAGDAAHIVPPTGAKGMNLAIADVHVLAQALASYYSGGGEALLQSYSSVCLRRIWKVQRFSWWMTMLLHRFPGDSPFDERRQGAELDYVVSSRAASTALAENYVGLPLE
jgi:p-hydroxybenzoate 3-monooxygenase